MIEGLKKGIDFAHLVAHLTETLSELQAADGEQKKAIRECLEQVKLLAALVRYQNERLNAIESRLSIGSFAIPIERNIEPDQQVISAAVLPDSKKKVKKQARKIS